MISILIADDERWIRTGVKQKIDWGNRFVCCGEAADGIEVYQLALNLRPDIIITDVRMPGMSGLTVIEKIKEVLPNTAVIVISGYSEFEYVKRAMDLGAVGYVLKPIDKEELSHSIEKALNYIHMHQPSGNFESPAALLSRTLYDFFNEIPVNRNNLYVTLEKVDLGKKRYWGCLLIQITHYNFDYDIVRQNLATALTLLDNKVQCILFEPGNALFGVMINTSTHMDLKKLAAELLDILKSKYQIIASISLGKVVTSVENLFDSIQCAKRGLHQIHPYDANEIIMPEQSKTHKIEFPAALEEELINVIYAYDKNRFANAINQIESYCTKNNISIGETKNFLTIILGNILRISYLGKVSQDTLNDGNLLLYKVNKMHQWTNIKTDFQSFCIKVKNDLSNNADNIMERSALYLKMNYTENITLNKIAHIFHLSPSYFSIMFKQYTGTTFSDYLIDLRINKAKELLKNSSLKVMQVAQMAGYDDYSYFGKLFRKHVGKTPKAYQAEHSIEE